ncbi:MAG: hypothetical protein HUK25_06500 [Treponema sp.]|nr:hypothetical protein [Treponema sp.]
MKNTLFLFAILFSIIFISCGTASVEVKDKTPASPEIEEPSNNLQETVVEEVETTETSGVQDSVEEVYPEVKVTSQDDEYLRSIGDIEVMEEEITYDEFAKDKAEILEIIDELSGVMSNFEFENWKTYIAPESLTYYSNPVNLRKAQKKLPDKMIQLKGLRDYFKYVFIPSRKVSKVEEIRYISKRYIKAVEVREEDNTTVVYYYFVKQNGKWFVKLPEIS